MKPYNATAFSAFLADLEALAQQTETERALRESPGTGDLAAITMLCVANIGGGPDLTIVYTDTDGVTSVRHIKVNSIERCLNGNIIVRVYDHDRKAPRSFRLDNIRAAATERREVEQIVWAD